MFGSGYTPGGSMVLGNPNQYMQGTWSPGGGTVQAGFGGQVSYRSSEQARAADPTYAARTGQSSQQRLNPNPALNQQLSDSLSGQLQHPGMSQDQINNMVSNSDNNINSAASAQQISLADKANAFGGGSSGGALAGSRAISDQATMNRANSGNNIRLGAAQQALQDRQQTMSTADRYLGRLTDQSQSDARFEASQEPRAVQQTGGGSYAGFGYQEPQQQASISFGAGRDRRATPKDGYTYGTTNFTQYDPVYSGNNSLGGRDQRLSNYSQGSNMSWAGQPSQTQQPQNSFGSTWLGSYFNR